MISTATAPSAQPVKVKRYYRNGILFLSLPMLGILSAYGVYAFNALFVPQLIAIFSCAAFELTVFGLAVAKINEDDQPYALGIAIASCVVAILYNAFAGYFHLMPQHRPGIGDTSLHVGWVILLVLLHGIPIPGLMLAVSWLLLHRSAMSTVREIDVTPQTAQSPTITVVDRRPRPRPKPVAQIPLEEALADGASITNLPNNIDQLQAILDDPDAEPRRKKNVRSKLRRLGVYRNGS